MDYSEVRKMFEGMRKFDETDSYNEYELRRLIHKNILALGDRLDFLCKIKMQELDGYEKSYRS